MDMDIYICEDVKFLRLQNVLVLLITDRREVAGQMTQSSEPPGSYSSLDYLKPKVLSAYQLSATTPTPIHVMFSSAPSPTNVNS